MKLELPEIHWHGNRERLMALHIFKGLLVTCGADMGCQEWIRLWRVTTSPFEITFVENVASNHERTVNVVKFSQSGQFIASGADDHCVMILEKRLRPVFGQDIEEESWGPKKVLRGHINEIHDLAWIEDDKFLASASMDASVIIFNTETGKVIQRLEGNGKYIQGLAWSNNALASMSNGKTLNVYKKAKNRYFKKHSIKASQGNPLFADEYSVSAYFRRPDFSPDQKLLVAPAGMINDKPGVHCFIKRLYEDGPTVSFPLEDKDYAIVVRFCPVLFDLPEESSTLFTGLPYKYVWAVGTKHSILIYSSTSATPIAVFAYHHYSMIHDLAWDEDQMLAACSNDGYCSFVTFESGELGQPAKIDDHEVKMDVEVEDKFQGECSPVVVS